MGFKSFLRLAGTWVIEVPEVIVLYYSRTGNTEKMAKAVIEGIRGVQGMDARLLAEASVTPEELADMEAIVVGMPTYHHDMTRSMKSLLEEVAVKGLDLRGRIGASFGSYGWSGEAPRLILEVMENRFGMKVIKPPLLVKYAPDEKGLEDCRRLGKNVAGQIARP